MADVLVLVEAAGLLVVVAGLVAVVVVVVVAGLELAGAFGAAEGLWATATEAIAQRAVSDVSKVIGLMVWGFC
jgi:hypothetical protein